MCGDYNKTKQRNITLMQLTLSPPLKTIAFDREDQGIVILRGNIDGRTQTMILLKLRDIIQRDRTRCYFFTRKAIRQETFSIVHRHVLAIICATQPRDSEDFLLTLTKTT